MINKLLKYEKKIDHFKEAGTIRYNVIAFEILTVCMFDFFVNLTCSNVSS